MRALLPDDARYILRKFPHARTPELEDYPSSRQMLLFLVSYPLGLVLVPVDHCRHVEDFFCVPNQ
jgi:hypothetical protein